MAHKDKGRKGDKGKGKKRDRAKNEAVLGTPVVAEAAPRVEAARKVVANATRPRSVATRRVATPAAAAHKVERPALPTDRASLLALHQAARRERDAAPRLSRERAQASFEIERIEVQIARVERAMDPPLV